MVGFPPLVPPRRACALAAPALFARWIPYTSREAAMHKKRREPSLFGSAHRQKTPPRRPILEHRACTHNGSGPGSQGAVCFQLAVAAAITPRLRRRVPLCLHFLLLLCLCVLLLVPASVRAECAPVAEKERKRERVQQRTSTQARVQYCPPAANTTRRGKHHARCQCSAVPRPPALSLCVCLPSAVRCTFPPGEMLKLLAIDDERPPVRMFAPYVSC